MILRCNNYMDPNGPLYWHNFVFDEQSDQFVFTLPFDSTMGALQTQTSTETNPINKSWCTSTCVDVSNCDDHRWGAHESASYFYANNCKLGPEQNLHENLNRVNFFLSYGKAPCYLVAGTSFCSNTILHECKKSQACSRWVGSAQKNK